MLALSDSSAPDMPAESASAKEWLSNDDEGFAALNTACEHLAGVCTIALEAGISQPSLPVTPSAWRALIEAAEHKQTPGALDDLDAALSTAARLGEMPPTAPAEAVLTGPQQDDSDFTPGTPHTPSF